MDQHIILVNPDQRGKDLTIRGKGGATKGAFEEVEDGDDPSDCLMCIAGAMDGDCGHR